MTTELRMKEVGPWPMNTYLIVCKRTKRSAVVDPGADAGEILTLAGNTHIDKILLTHGHRDHTGALAEIKQMTGAPVLIHPLDAQVFNVKYDHPLVDGDLVELGDLSLRVIHTPGHTPGAVCFDLGDGRVVVGDALFVGGPGKTADAERFNETMRNMQAIFFSWPDETRFYPGHGPSGCIGDERSAFEAFIERGWLPDLYGDVIWS